MKVLGIFEIGVRKLKVGRSVPTEPRTSGGEHFLDGVEDGDSRETFDGSPGRTRPTSESETLPIRFIHTPFRWRSCGTLIECEVSEPD
jgi:hypothetical protein